MVKRRAKHMVNLKENGNKTKKPSPSALGSPADLHPSKVDFTLGCPWAERKVQTAQPTGVFIIIFDMECN